jgi:hypothetical protein
MKIDSGQKNVPVLAEIEGDEMADRQNTEESKTCQDRGESDRTLLPMLIGGLFLVVAGAMIVMTFV